MEPMTPRQALIRSLGDAAGRRRQAPASAGQRALDVRKSTDPGPTPWTRGGLTSDADKRPAQRGRNLPMSKHPRPWPTGPAPSGAPARGHQVRETPHFKPVSAPGKPAAGVDKRGAPAGKPEIRGSSVRGGGKPAS